jgi:hypothetical protein
VLLTHDEITVALKSRRQAAAWQFASGEKRAPAGKGISWPLVTTRSGPPGIAG